MDLNENTAVRTGGQTPRAGDKTPGAGNQIPGAGEGEIISERLQKIMSAHGVASRREAERMISSGRVTVNGETAVPGGKAAPGRDEILVDGRALAQRNETVYIMLNKPRGYVTTMRDDRGRKTVLDLVSGAGPGVYPAGRLDMWSEGLLLMTNDGRFAHAVMHPSNEKTKVYEASVSGDMERALRMMRAPMEIDGRLIRAEFVEQIRKAPDGGALRIAIHEGRNRQIRKMCKKSGIKVKALRRTAIGSLELGGLKPGQWRHLEPDEINIFI